MERFDARRADEAERRTLRAQLKSALITTIGGPKGAVTLSIILSLPYFTDVSNYVAFPQRTLLIFMASGAIVITLLLANFLMPVLTPAPKSDNPDLPESDEEIAEAKIAILQQVISRLAEEQDKGNERATVSVIRGYTMRIQRVRMASDIDSSDAVMLRMRVLERQRDTLFALRSTGRAGDVETFANMLRIARMQSLLAHRRSNGWMIAWSLRHLPATVRWGVRYATNWARRISGKRPILPDAAVHRAIEEETVAYLQELLDAGDSAFPDETIHEQLDAHKSVVSALNATLAVSNPNATIALVRVGAKRRAIERHAYHLELDEIDAMQESGAISRATARKLRDNVYLMLVDLEDNV